MKQKNMQKPLWFIVGVLIVVAFVFVDRSMNRSSETLNSLQSDVVQTSKKTLTISDCLESKTFLKDENLYCSIRDHSISGIPLIEKEVFKNMNGVTRVISMPGGKTLHFNVDSSLGETTVPNCLSWNSELKDTTPWNFANPDFKASNVGFLYPDCGNAFFDQGKYFAYILKQEKYLQIWDFSEGKQNRNEFYDISLAEYPELYTDLLGLSDKAYMASQDEVSFYPSEATVLFKRAYLNFGRFLLVVDLQSRKVLSYRSLLTVNGGRDSIIEAHRFRESTQFPGQVELFTNWEGCEQVFARVSANGKTISVPPEQKCMPR